MTEKIKMTALNPLVGASGEQSLNNTNCIIAEIDSRSNGNELETKTMEEIYDTAYKIKIPIIDGLLYNGMYLFVGAPKIGKSFTMAQIGYHVSKGLPLWGYPVNQGSVLYLALEDNFERIQAHLVRMFDMDTSSDFYFATKSDTLNTGLEMQIINFLHKHSDTRLVIIDTLQKVRDCTGMNYSYANDYEIVTKLKKISDEYNICILVVHHTRKMEASDSFDTVSGTNGLLGAADGAFVMQKEKRTDNKATIEIVGRDQQDPKLNVEFDREKCVWNLINAETELWKERPNPLLESIAKLVTEESPEWRGSATELLQLLPVEDMRANTLSRKLNVYAEQLYKNYKILYEQRRTHDTKLIILKLDNECVDCVRVR